MATRKRTPKLGDSARTLSAFYKLLIAAGCVFCPTCYAYMLPDHSHAVNAKMPKAA